MDGLKWQHGAVAAANNMFRLNFVFVLLINSLLMCIGADGQTPADFHWVNFKTEAATVSNVERTLKGEEYSAIREIGVTDRFALVLTVQREAGQTTFDGDMWRVYSISIKTWNVQTLLTGYRLQVKDWINFDARTSRDLGLVYMDCWECEATTVFTALHYDSSKGWRARWPNEKDPNHPGITMLITDVGDPYTNEEVDQTFRVIAPANDVSTVGTWYHSKDLSTGKISETVTKFWIDKATGKEKTAELTGEEARAWKLSLCKAGSAAYGLSQGQSSRACRSLTRAKGTAQ